MNEKLKLAEEKRKEAAAWVDLGMANGLPPPPSLPVAGRTKESKLAWTKLAKVMAADGRWLQCMTCNAEQQCLRRAGHNGPCEFP